jgi:hypothetical protein
MDSEIMKTSKIPDNKIKPLFQKIISRNMNESSGSPSKYNIYSTEKKDTQNYQISLPSDDNSINFKAPNITQEEKENYMLYKKYLLSKSQYNNKMKEITNIDNKYTENKNEIEKLEKNLENLKNEKKEKQMIIIDLLAQKESLEEIYKIKFASLLKKTNIITDVDINRTKQLMKKNKNVNDNKDNNDTPNDKLFDSFYILEDNEIEISVDDIKKSDQKKYEEKVIKFCEDLLQKKDDELKNTIIDKIKCGYQIFNLNTSSYTCLKLDNIITNFFLRASSVISKESNGKYSEKIINSFLKILLRLNNINEEMSEILQFLNKTYKNTKKEIKETINELNKKNENLNNKKKSYESIKEELKQFIDENKVKVKKYLMAENEKRLYISFMENSCFQNDFDFLEEVKKMDKCETERKNNKIDKNDIFEKNMNIKNNSNRKGFNSRTKPKKLDISEVNNLNNVIINIPYDNKRQNSSKINVNNVLINNNVNVKIDKIDNNTNNNLMINNNGDNASGIQNTPKSKRSAVIPTDIKNNTLKKIKIPHRSNQKTFKSPSNKNKQNIVKNKLFPIENKDNNSIRPKYFTPRKNIDTSNDNSIYNNINKSFNNNSMYINITKNMPQTLCYFQISDKNSDPNNKSKNNNDASDPTKLNYYEGYILIDNTFNKLKIVPKTDRKFIGIDLNNIADVKTIQKMEKIKNIKKKSFILSIIIDKKFIPKADFIFDNDKDFKLWHNCLDSIAKINKADNNRK